MNSKKSVPLISFVGDADWDLFPHFVEHYRALGVGSVNVILHGHIDSEVEGILKDLNVAVLARVEEQFTEALKNKYITEAAKKFVGQWILTVDVDEFVELPFTTLNETVNHLEMFSMSSLPALLVQRISPDGRLSEVGSSTDVSSTFSRYDFNLCERISGGRPCWKLKFPLSFVTKDYQSHRGFHFPPNRQIDTCVPLRGILNHYKWRSALKKAFEQDRGDDTNFNEMICYRKYLEENDWKLPLDSSHEYNLLDLAERGFIVSPEKSQADLYQAFGLLKDYLKEKKPLSRQDRGLLAEHLGFKSSELANIGKKLISIAFVTFEVVGPKKCGGIGTAVSALAEILSNFGFKVKIIYCPFTEDDKNNPIWHEYWSSRGVEVIDFPRYGEKRRYPSPKEFQDSLLNYVEGLNVDIVHFDDASDFGLRCAIGRSAGSHLKNTSVVTTTHGNARWHFRGNGVSWKPGEESSHASFERQMQCSDLVIHPSRYMFKHTEHLHGPKTKHIVIPNLLSGINRSFYSPSVKNAARGVTELVFFGRIEKRKGLDHFLAVCRRVSESGEIKKFKVTFLGEFGAGIDKSYISSRLKGLNVEVSYKQQFDSFDAISYLKANNVLVLLLSTQDNLPYTVYECLENRIPMICSQVGGITEMIDDSDLSRITYENINIDSLSSKVSEAFLNGFLPGKLSFKVSDVIIDFLKALTSLKGGNEARDRGPKEKHRILEFVFKPHYSINKIDTTVREREFDISQLLSGSTDRFYEVLYQSPADYVSIRSMAIRFTRKDAVDTLLKLLSNTSFSAAVSDFYYRTPCDHFIESHSTKFKVTSFPEIQSPSSNIFGADFALFRKSDLLKALEQLEGPITSYFPVWKLLNSIVSQGGRVAAVPLPLVSVSFNYSYSGAVKYDSFLGEQLALPWLNSATDESSNLMIRKSIYHDSMTDEQGVLSYQLREAVRKIKPEELKAPGNVFKKLFNVLGIPRNDPDKSLHT